MRKLLEVKRINRTSKPTLRTCRGCFEMYDEKQVARSLGKESMVYMLGFCTADCYTKFYHPVHSDPNGNVNSMGDFNQSRI
jgi:hypothetical protein